MKTIFFTLALFLSLFVNANDEKYFQQMGKQIQAVYTAENIEQLLNCVNTFDRIAAAEQVKWEPYYYSAFGSVMMANRETDPAKKDLYLDKALAAIENGKKIATNESELIALEGFVHMIRVTVDPANRGREYSGLAFQNYNKALSINPENPRALAFTAQMQMGTARFLNAPTTEACSTNQKALEKFDTYKSSNMLAPKWGKSMAESLLKQCQ